MGFTVAIVGRPNVGKSTFFNRLVGDRQAIVENISGVTRDRQYGTSYWNGRNFDVVDTGGFVKHSEDVFEKAIRTQVEIAIQEASAIVFLVDTTTGVTDLDQEMANMLRKSPKRVFLAVNKCDNQQRLLDANEFYSLGFKDLYPLAAISGAGTGELLDALTQLITEDQPEDQFEGMPKIAIVGQPNVGKSSLLNALIGQERNIVTPIAGTTRDATHTHYNMYGKDLVLLDTAGIRKKSKVFEQLEFYSVIRAIKAIDESDVCIVVLDATLGIEGQDLSIIGQVERKKKGLVIAVNKWDLVEDKDTNTSKKFEEAILHRLQPFTDVPILFISVLEKQRIHKVLDTALEVYKNRTRRIPGSQLNDVMLDAIEKNHPPAYKGKFIKIKYVSQLPTPSPNFAFFGNNVKYIRENYKNYLENKLRESFDFNGVPIILVFRDKAN
jgi:GTP-binding protein